MRYSDRHPSSRPRSAFAAILESAKTSSLGDLPARWYGKHCNCRHTDGEKGSDLHEFFYTFESNGLIANKSNCPLHRHSFPAPPSLC